MQISDLAWSSDDAATFSRWRRAVCIFYCGCIGLILVAAWSAHPPANSDQGRAVSIEHSPAKTSASVIPASARR